LTRLSGCVGMIVSLRFILLLIASLSSLSSTSCLAGARIQVFESGCQPGHYLSWNGKPLLFVGDSATQGWMECGTHFDQKPYVDALASRGIHLLMIWTFIGTNASTQKEDGRLGYDAPEMWPWMGSPDDKSFDLLQFNPEYFDRLHDLVAYAEEKSVAVLITVHDGWTKTRFGCHPFNCALGNGPLSSREQYVELPSPDSEMPAQFCADWNWRERNQFFQERFCAQVISTLKPFTNVLYEMFNEGEWYDTVRRLEHEEHFLRFFRDRCSNLLLSNASYIRRFDPYHDSGVDVVSLHSQGWTGLFDRFAKSFLRSPAKPCFLSEPVPEFDGVTPSLDEVRRSVWETTLGGAGWVNQNDASFGWDSRAAIASRSTQRDSAYDVAGYCARFFDGSGVRFWDMSPMGGLASTGVCLALPGVEYVVYAPEGGSLTVDLSEAAWKDLKVYWLNPRTGKVRVAPGVHGGCLSERFEVPFSGDAVLHLSVDGD
jgi:hypothetical protein